MHLLDANYVVRLLWFLPNFWQGEISGLSSTTAGLPSTSVLSETQTSTSVMSVNTEIQTTQTSTSVTPVIPSAQPSLDNLEVSLHAINKPVCFS